MQPGACLRSRAGVHVAPVMLEGAPTVLDNTIRLNTSRNGCDRCETWRAYRLFCHARCCAVGGRAHCAPCRPTCTCTWSTAQQRAWLPIGTCSRSSAQHCAWLPAGKRATGARYSKVRGYEAVGAPSNMTCAPARLRKRVVANW